MDSYDKTNSIAFKLLAEMSEEGSDLHKYLVLKESQELKKEEVPQDADEETQDPSGLGALEEEPTKVPENEKFQAALNAVINYLTATFGEIKNTVAVRDLLSQALYDITQQYKTKTGSKEKTATDLPAVNAPVAKPAIGRTVPTAALLAAKKAVPVPTRKPSSIARRLRRSFGEEKKTE